MIRFRLLTTLLILCISFPCYGGGVMFDAGGVDDTGGGPSVVATDPLTGTANPLGGDWTRYNVTGWGDLRKESGNAYGTLGSASNAVWWNADSFNDNQYAKATLSNVTFAGVCLRVNTSTGMYFCYTTDTRLYVYRHEVSGDVLTNLVNVGSYISTTVSANDVIEMQITGTQITVKIDGVTVADSSNVDTDSTYTSGTTGMYMFGNTGRLNTFEAGNL